MRPTYLPKLLFAAVSVGGVPGAAAQPAAVPVAVVEPQTISVAEELRLTGTLVAERDARLSTRVDGLVAEIAVDAGDRVETGEPLMELDPALARHALRRAEASVDEARARVTEAERLIDEARRLIDEQHIPQTEVARREAEAALARAALAAAEADAGEQVELLSRHTLPAPFDGIITRRLTDLGEWVVRGTPVLELVSTEHVWLDVQAPQERFSRIAESVPVDVLVDSLPGKTLAGRIRSRVPVSESGARTFLVRISIDAGEHPLLPGTSATAVIGLAGGEPALSVPREALRRYPDGSHSVFVVSSADGVPTARERRVTIGRDGANVEVVEGIERGERVVVRGHDGLRDGQRIRIGSDS